MIRYSCPHCGRRCESADVLRGFPVICLGCRQSIRVPEQSTVADDDGPTPKQPNASSSSPNRPSGSPAAPQAATASSVAPPRVAAKYAKADVLRSSPAIDASFDPGAEGEPARRWRWIIGFAGLALVAVIVSGIVALSRRTSRFPDAADETTQRAARIRENFNPQTLAKVAAKHPSWKFAPLDQPKLNGKWVILSTDSFPELVTFWDRIVTMWQVMPRVWRDRWIDELWKRGQVDEMMFALDPARWAEGIGETDLIVGIHWWKETIAVHRGEQAIPIRDGWLSADGIADWPVSQRWRAVAYVLDRATATVIAWQEFEGKPPTRPPSASRKRSVGPRPSAELLEWLRRLDAGQTTNPPN